MRSAHRVGGCLEFKTQTSLDQECLSDQNTARVWSGVEKQEPVSEIGSWQEAGVEQKQETLAEFASSGSDQPDNRSDCQSEQ